MIKNKNLPIILLILLCVAVLWALVCTQAGGVVSVWSVLRRLSPFILAFAVFTIFLSLRKPWTEKILFIVLCGYALIECGLGVAQLAGWVRSRHDFYQLTGNFLNPAPYACFLGIAAICCLVTLFRRSAGREIKTLAWVTLVWSTGMVVIARSRAVWLGLALAFIAALIKETNLWSRIKHKCLVVCCGVAVFLAGCIVAWMLKPESAEARFYTWQVDCLAIGGHPLLGVGPGAEMGAFGDAQSDYFRSHVRSWHRQQAADIPQTPFNEFLKMGMTCGIPGLLLAVAIFSLTLAIEIRNRRLWAYPLIVLGTFAMFSFPLCQFALSLILTLALSDAINAEEWRNKHLKIADALAIIVIVVMIPFCRDEVRQKSELKQFLIETREQTLDANVLAAYYDSLRDKPAYLSVYGKALYDECLYEEALSVFERLERMTADPTIPIIRGEICRLSGNPSGAAEAFLKSYYTAPSRLTAVYNLMLLYGEYGLFELAARTKEFALSLPVDAKHTATMEVRHQIEKYLLTNE